MAGQRGDDRIIALSKEDRAILQETSTYVKRQLLRMESYKRVIESAQEVRLRLVGRRVSLQVRGKTVEVNGDLACWTDPPGVCAPGACPEDTIRA
jgi:hypothetical protein